VPSIEGATPWIAGDVLEFPLIGEKMSGDDLAIVQSNPDAGHLRRAVGISA
jgi:hypothetical protein